MIATIRAEWRKSRLRPAFLVGAGLIGGITVIAYAINWYLALHPGSAGDRGAVNIATLYPDQFVSNVMGAAFPVGAAISIVVGAIFAGTEFAWSTVKTMLTQGPGRLTIWMGRVAVFAAWMLIITIVLFAVGAASSVVVATFQGHGLTWPAAIDIAKGMGAIWLIFFANGAIGLAVGTLLRSSAPALGIGLIYVLAVEIIAVRFIGAINNGAYKWISDLFVNQNATALAQSFRSAAAGPTIAPTIGVGHAVFVLLVYAAGLVIVGAGLLRLRDVT